MSIQSNDVLGIYGLCRSCQVGKSCLLKNLPEKDIEQFEHIVERKLLLKKAAHLFRQNQNFSSIYVVQSGTLKSYSSSFDNNEQITRVHFPGDIIGLSAIAKKIHPNSVKALETATVCELPYTSIQDLCRQLPDLQQNLFKLISNEVHKIQQQRACLRQKSAEARYAAYLLGVYGHNTQRGHVSHKIQLCMSRYDISNYLNLAQETVCRVSSRFQKKGLISIDNETINLIELESLEKIAGPAWQMLKMSQPSQEISVS